MFLQPMICEAMDKETKEIEKSEEKVSYPVLIVDDERFTRKLFESMLRKMGKTVRTAENGLEALDILSKEFFPIILTDWQMPEMDGLELCRKIRAMEQEGYCYIFMVTANRKKEDVITGLGAGADDYLFKPLDKAVMMARLQTCERVLNLTTSLRKANEEITLLSITDALTGVYNRTHFNDLVVKEVERSRRYKRPLSYAICDIDHFKLFNDTHGHIVGDLVLQEFAACLGQSIRDDVDTLFRYGGEEFVVLMPETRFDDAMLAVERLRKTVEELVVDHAGTPLSITASFGVSSCDFTGDAATITFNQFTDSADTRLYEAKDAGRNCVRGIILSD